MFWETRRAKKQGRAWEKNKSPRFAARALAENFFVAAAQLRPR
jgi:hypothetical protein